MLVTSLIRSKEMQNAAVEAQIIRNIRGLSFLESPDALDRRKVCSLNSK
jgi:hypothetical protein